MTDQITEYVAKKLTKNQKRSGGGSNSSEMQNDRRHLDTVAVRPPEVLRAAQRHLASLALEHPDLADDAAREVWLEDVLASLDLLRRITTPESREACFPHTGTVRGYNIHLRGYTVPCMKCKNVWDAIESERLAALGLVVEKEQRWLMTTS